MDTRTSGKFTSNPTTRRTSPSISRRYLCNVFICAKKYTRLSGTSIRNLDKNKIIIIHTFRLGHNVN